MENLTREELRGHSKVRVLPFETGWTVFWQGGHYSCPYTKEAAMAKAATIAIQAGLTGFEVLNEPEMPPEWIHLPSSMESILTAALRFQPRSFFDEGGVGITALKKNVEPVVFREPLPVADPRPGADGCRERCA